MNSPASNDQGSAAAIALRALHPDDFCGQKLVVIFCPTDPEAANARLEAYRAQAEAFQRCGAWLVAVPPNGYAPAPGDNSHLTLAADPNGLAFQSLAARFPGMLETTGEAVFVLDRDGVARHAWTGSPQVDEVFSGVRERP